MKIWFLALSVLGLAAAYFLMRPGKPARIASDPATLHEGTLAMTMPAEEVFKRALWRRPTPEDKILHAERREWTKDSHQGVAHWQWFLAVEPGPALKKWLREKNPFSVQRVAATAVPEIQGAPLWFPTEFSSYEIQAGSPRGSLVLLWSREGDTLYATGSGTGFTPGAPNPSAPIGAPQGVSQGRLPATPPPAIPKS